MNRNARQAIGFVFVLIILVICLQKLVDYAYNSCSQNKFNLLLKHKTDEELMVWGSSVAVMHIDPAIMQRSTGLGCYNEGWHGVFYAQYSGMLKEYLAYQKKCKCILIACDFENLGRNQLITEPYLFLSHLSNDNLYRSLHRIEPEKMFRARYIPGYKFGLLTKNFYLTFLGGTHSADPNNGYRPVNKTWEGEVKGNELRMLPFLPEVYDDFVATVRDITAKGIEVVLVVPPVYNEGYKILIDPQVIKNKYRILAENNHHVHYLDFSCDSMSMNQGYFYNNYHMNVIGATLFSEKLGKDVGEILRQRG